MTTYVGKAVRETALFNTPGFGSYPLNPIHRGQALRIASIHGNREWFATNLNGQPGYVLAKHVAIHSAGRAGVIAAPTGTALIRSTPHIGGNMVFLLSNGTSVQVIDEIVGWKRISSSQGTGWLLDSFVS